MKPGHKLWVVSNIMMDVAAYVDQWPEHAGDILAHKGLARPGGAFNVIAAASRLGMKTVYGGLVGGGPFGQTIQKHLKELNVKMALAPINDGDTGFAIAIVEPNGQPTYITVLGCERQLHATHLRSLEIAAEDAVYLSGYNLVIEPSATAIPHWLPTLKASHVLLDPGPLIRDIPPKLFDEVIQYVSILSLNQREAALLTGKTKPDAALRVITEQVQPNTTVIIRVGADGAWVMDASGNPLRIPTRQAHAADTTGAGDVHCAALLARMTEVSFEQAVYEANICASLAVERLGSSESPSLPELKQCLRQIQRYPR